jgi:hypothetical protein
VINRGDRKIPLNSSYHTTISINGFFDEFTLNQQLLSIALVGEVDILLLHLDEERLFHSYINVTTPNTANPVAK